MTLTALLNAENGNNVYNNKLLSVLPPRRWYSLRAYLLLKII
jgi:hypothetical protein